jgi:hypothetical protein
MKRNVFILALALCLCAGLARSAFAAFSQGGRDYWYFREHPVVSHPILTKVFPGVEFRVVLGLWPTVNGVHAYLNNDSLIMPISYNLLYVKIADSARATLNERIEAFVRLALWTKTDSLTIENIESIRVEDFGAIYNYRVRISFPSRAMNRYRELIMQINDQGKIQSVISVQYGRYVHLWSMFSAVDSDDATLAVGGAAVQSEAYENITYHYLPVSINGSATGNSYLFTVSGLTPDSMVWLQIMHAEYGIITNHYLTDHFSR